MLKGAIELSLLSRSIEYGFLKQSRESKRLGHDRSADQDVFWGATSREYEDTDTSRKDHLESIGHIQTVPVERWATG